MRLWRIARREFAALDGEGGRLYGGRWTPAGYPVIHASATAALAVLERLVHTRQHVGVDLALLPIDLPDTVPKTLVLEETLPDTWRRTPAPEPLQRIGLAWLLGGDTAVLCVPSALVPVEQNYLLNPAHKDFARIKAGDRHTFVFDPRLMTRAATHQP